MAKDERLYTDFTSGNFAFHLFRYWWAIPFAYNKVVLDAGCGSGYGAEMLSTVARSVVAVDYDPEALTENRSKYGYRRNLSFALENVAELSFPDDSFDLIVSFEVFEHLDAKASEQFLQHVCRLCRPGGWVLLSTPNRLVEVPFMKSAGQSYGYHVNSVSPGELKARLLTHFKSVRLFGQRAKAPWLKGALKALDILNLRHWLLSYRAKQGLDAALSGKAYSTSPELLNIQIGRSLIRQSGIILATCKK